ncbi:gas vesicle protein K [Spartinivicinus ruber]|uniref:gas vesicle protein K n=1 Tax=Spartinivicinus ruber TaxID=2683272 RepID=UPI0013D599D1|nr:gas vesicle protein K [Spartinivicinus ruber]
MTVDEDLLRDSVQQFEHLFANNLPRQINIDGDQVGKGLSQLVLTLIKLLHELLERQAIRRMETGQLSDDDIERLGTTLMQQAQEIERLRDIFGLREEDLTLDLGPLGKLV